MHRFFTQLPLLLLMLAWGCSSPESNSGSPVASPAEEGGIKRVSADTLPALGQPLPPLENGTLTVYSPAKAKLLSRSTKYICGFYYLEASSPPRLLLTAEENPIPSITKVTEDNLEEFAELMKEHLKKQEITPLEPVLPMVIGNMPCVRYVLATRFRSSKAERQVLDTIRNGKLYRLDLQVADGEIPTYRDDAYAVMAHLEFTDSAAPAPGGEPAPSEAAPSEPAAETPAEEAAPE